MKIHIAILFFVVHLMIMLVTDCLGSNNWMIMIYELERMCKEAVDLNFFS
jgi:hypothetical protein